MQDIKTGAPREAFRPVDGHGRDFRARKHRFPANPSGFLIAPVLWFAYFVAIYSLQGAGCAAGLDRTIVLGVGALNLVLALLTAVVLVVIAVSGLSSYRAWHGLRPGPEDEDGPGHGHGAFLAHGALLHAGLFLVATLWTGIPILLLGPCNGLGG